MRWNILRAGAVIGLALLAISLLLIGKPLEKLESHIKERCDGEKVQSGVTSNRPAPKARAAN